MPWFKVDDGLHSHPKALAAGDAALGAWVRLGSWSSKHSTDGLIPDSTAKVMLRPAQIRQLLDVGLLVKVAGGYALHDFLDYNPSREEVEADRAATAERVKAWRRKRAGNGVTAPVTNGVRTPSPTRPDPTRPSVGVQRSEKEPFEVDLATDRARLRVIS